MFILRTTTWNSGRKAAVTVACSAAYSWTLKMMVMAECDSYPAIPPLAWRGSARTCSSSSLLCCFLRLISRAGRTETVIGLWFRVEIASVVETGHLGWDSRDEDCHWLGRLRKSIESKPLTCMLYGLSVSRMATRKPTKQAVQLAW